MIDMAVLGQTAGGELPALPGLPMEGSFFSLFKIIVMGLFLFLWAFPAGWCSRDAKGLSLNQFLWGSIILIGAIMGWLFWFLLPVYLVGLMFYVLFGFGVILVYALYRDTIVEEKNKILNPTNFLAALKGHKETGFKLEEKVQLATTDGREPKVPEELEGQKLYQSFQDLLFDGLWRRANEILIQPAGEKARVTFKIDGVANEYDQWERLWAQGVVDYVKGICRLNLDERRQPQKGKLVAKQVDVNRKVQLDILTQGSTAGEQMLIRVRAEEAKFTVDDIGFTDEQLDQLKGILSAKAGLVILSGMPDSGLTSTLYAIGRSLDAFTQNIHSVEAKPLMDLDNITQNVYQAGSDKSFAKMIQSISRREPDTILVDPCAEPETAQMLAQIVGDKKKKIFTTLRASSSFSALGRITRWIEDPERSSDILLAVTFQRLVRKLCPACREAYKPNPKTLQKMNFTADEAMMFYRPPSVPLVDKKGNQILCPTCQGSGYLGRTGVFEILTVDDALRGAIRSGDPNRIKAAARKSGSKFWEEVALEKVVAGITSVQEVIRVGKEAEALAEKKQ
jgi:type II secretory ATPase GspE/PulE/Tfp pilus assembly ATPase PilB-like protein